MVFFPSKVWGESRRERSDQSERGAAQRNPWDPTTQQGPQGRSEEIGKSQDGRVQVFSCGVAKRSCGRTPVPVGQRSDGSVLAEV